MLIASSQVLFLLHAIFYPKNIEIIFRQPQTLGILFFLFET
jgi:hypothetical protein